MENSLFRFGVLFLGFLLLFFFLCSSSLAVYTGDDTYTDNNNTIKIAYDSLVSDFLVRIDNTSSTNYKTQILNHLKSGNYSFYAFYGGSDGTGVVNAMTYETRYLYIVLFPNNSVNLTMSSYTNYMGMNCDVYEVASTSDFLVYGFNGNTIIPLTPVTTYYIPAILINYKPQAFIEYFTDSSSAQTSAVVEAIESSAQDTQSTIESSAQATQNVIKDDTVSDSTMVVDDSYSVTDSEGVGNFLLTFCNNVYTYFSNMDASVSVINIPIPFVENQYITLRSDVISSHVDGTSLGLLIDLIWWFFFGTYYVIFIQRIINWFSTGKVLEQGPSSFIDMLNKENAVIKAYMM